MELEFVKEIIRHEHISDIEINKVRDRIQRVLSYYTTLKDSSNDEPKKDLFKQEDEDIKEYNEIVDSIGGLQIQNSVAKYLLQNPQIMKSIFDRIINESIELEDRPFYTVDLNQSSELILKQIIKDLRKSTTDTITIEMVRGVLENFINISDAHLKSDYIKLLNNSLRFLNRYNLIDFYIKRNNTNMEKVNLEGLKIEDNNIISKEFETENLEKKPIEELLFLNVFYQNRLTKEKKKIYDSIFFIEELNLWNNQEGATNIGDEVLKQLIIKKRVIDRVNEKYKRRSDSPQHIGMIKKYIKIYRDYFNSIFPDSKNDLADDCMQTLYWNLHSRKIYDTKLDLTYKVFEILMNRTKINWGYIQSQLDKNEDKDFLLLGIDFPGYNMPMTVHMKKETLVAFLSGMQASTIPMYIGNEDMLIRNNRMPTNILYKLPEDKKGYINDIAKTLKKNPKSHQYPDFVHHLNSLAKGIMPYNHKQKRSYINVGKLDDSEPGGRE